MVSPRLRYKPDDNSIQMTAQAATASDDDPPAAPALVIGKHLLTATAAALETERRASALSAAGLEAGEILLCAADDPVEILLLQHALPRLGAGLLPYAPGLAAGEIDALTAAVGAEWHCADGEPRPTGQRREAAATATRDAQPALLVRTSGSGGTPKVVMLTQAQLRASAVRANAALDLRPGDQWLCCLPLHHVGGLAIGRRCALAGAAVRLVSAGDAPGAANALRHRHPSRCWPEPLAAVPAALSGFEAAAVADTLARYPITHVSLVPAMLARLLNLLPAPPPALRVLLLGGQGLHPALGRRAAAAGWPLHVSYGMSETGSMIAVGPWLDDNIAGTRAGPPLAAVVLDCARHDEPPRRLRLRGPMVMAGYASPARLPGVGLDEGWLDTADLARLDGDGALRIFGRADELVVIGGAQVSPAAVEGRLAAAPGVDEVVVVALPHQTWGATLAACWRGPATPEGLAAWCRGALPSRERPRVLRQVHTLPLLPSGKPDRRSLIESLIGAPLDTPDTPCEADTRD
jgi:O-succinylbenzoic acid--CoA ligase